MRKLLLIPLIVLAMSCAPETAETEETAADEQQEPMETATTADETAGSAQAGEPPAVGEAAPDFTLESHEGEPVRLASDQGQPVVLAFYRGHW